MKKSILVAEDEPDILKLVCMHLRAAGFEAIRASDGPSALEQARESGPALIVLDLMLPGMSGLEICKSLKSDAATAGIPIVMLTAKAKESDRIAGLQLGADDYIVKPFSPRELVLRVQSVLRRTEGQPETLKVLKMGEITLDRAHHEVKIGGQKVMLTATEFKLLALLIERKGRIQSRDQLLQDVWGYENAIDTRTVDTHITRLREKLGTAAAGIETIRGFGYRMAEGNP